MTRVLLCLADGIGFMVTSTFLVMVSLLVTLLLGFLKYSLRSCRLMSKVFKRGFNAYLAQKIRWFDKGGTRWIEVRLAGVRVLVSKGKPLSRGVIGCKEDVGTQKGLAEESRTKEDSPERVDA